MAITSTSLTPPSAAARSLGGTAEALLHDGARGQIAAVFNTSVYLATSSTQRYLCLLPGTAPDGPLHVLVDGSAMPWSRTLRIGQSWRVADSTLHFEHAHLALGRATSWSSGPLERTVPAELFPAPAYLSSDHFSRLAHRSAALAAVTRSDGPWPRFAHVAVNSLKHWLADTRGITQLGPAVRALTGLGEGLTPAGDDLLGGLALMLRARGSTQLTALIGAVTPCLTKTHPISAAHLFEALSGRPSAPALAALRGLACGDTDAIEQACAQLGHTSGWDMLAGLLLGTSSRLESQSRKSP